jgi:hypothetical protein
VNKIRISYRPDKDGEDYGWLELAVQADGFAGAVGFWSQPYWFSDFAKRLNEFPIDPSNPPEVTIHATQAKLRPTIQMKLEPADAQGQLWLMVWLADDWDTKNQVSLGTTATYAWAQRFSEALGQFVEPPHPTVEMEIY